MPGHSLRALLLVLAAAAPASIAIRSLAADRQPVYVGARACATCHDGPGMGHQFSRWMLSRHARAYASLSLPEARRIADMSGIPGDPHESPICLGCHATASDAEPWERDPAFRTIDGVQCERCHGPGSEYMDEKVMRERKAATAAGLVIPTRAECAKCHYVKGSHAAVHRRPQLDMDAAWKSIAHATPESPSAGGLGEPEVSAPAPGPRQIGVEACAKCHNTAGMNRQANHWRLSLHSRAWAVLTTPEAAEIARKKGLTAAPQASPECLRCHTTPGARDRGASVADGVTCEACHGSGSEYAAEAVMRDRIAARRAGLAEPTAKSCVACHCGEHGKPFDAAAAMTRIAHPSRPAPVATGAGATRSGAVRHKTPRNLAVRPGGAEVWVACEAADSVIVVDATTRAKVAEIAVGGQPNDVTFSPDGGRAYVSNRLDDSVSVIDAATRRVTATVTVGDEPHGLLTDRSGRRLYVLNAATNDISVVDTEALAESHRLPAGRSPWSLALSPDGSTLLATNTLSHFVPFRQPSVSEVTVVDAPSGRIADRISVPGTNLLQGVAWHPSGDFALFTMNRTKNLVPMTRVQQGWTITNGLGVAWRDGRTDQILLDEPNECFADAADVTFTPDGRIALVTSQGTNRVAVVDVAKLTAVLTRATPRERAEVVPNHLGKSREFVVAYVATRSAPRGVAVAADGSVAFVANQIDDSLTVIDLSTYADAGRIDLGGPGEESHIRRGERLFHSASITFQRQFSCASCHPDGHVDGLTYDIEADGIGVGPVDNRTLRGIYDTDPFKWEGTNPSLARQCGARLAAFFTRIQPFTPGELSAVNDYTVTIPRPPNRFRAAGAELTEAQARGKRVFERTQTNDRREIPPGNRCITCHFPPLYTDRARHDVGTRNAFDRTGSFDVPHLNNIYDSAPYLHDGGAATLEEIWTRFNPGDAHGVTNDMTKDQLNDLIEYLKTL